MLNEKILIEQFPSFVHEFYFPQITSNVLLYDDYGTPRMNTEYNSVYFNLSYTHFKDITDATSGFAVNDLYECGVRDFIRINHLLEIRPGSFEKAIDVVAKSFPNTLIMYENYDVYKEDVENKDTSLRDETSKKLGACGFVSINNFCQLERSEPHVLLNGTSYPELEKIIEKHGVIFK